MKKATKKEVLDVSIEQAEKYFNLVWLARKSQDDMNIPEIREGILAVIKKYPKDTDDLQGENGDWTHAFNNGCLATFRFIIDAIEYGVEEAQDNFPHLDS